MTFSLTPDRQNNSSDQQEGSPRKTIDWNGFNAHVQQVVGSGNYVGIVAMITDLGYHNQEDAKFDSTKTPEQEAEDIANKPETYFEDGVDEEAGKRFKRWPRKPVQQVAISADFPELLINYGKFFSEDGQDEFKPYRAVLNREWDQVLQGYDLVAAVPKVKGGVWTFSEKAYIRKLAKACGMEDTICNRDMDVGKLLGGVFTCDITATINNSGDNKYLNVRIGVPSVKHQAIPVPEYSIAPQGISFTNENSPEALEYLDGLLIKKIKSANNYEGSVLQAQLEGGNTAKKGDTTSEAHNGSLRDDEATPSADTPDGVKASEEPPVASEGVSEDEWDDQIPF